MGRIRGSTLTLDGDCEGCWNGGQHLFKQTVKVIREQFKKEMQDASHQEAFFNAYSKAKAAGVSEQVLKRICESYHERTRKQSRSDDDGGVHRPFKRSCSSANTSISDGVSAAPSKVPISVGLSGKEISIDVTADLSIEDVRRSIQEAYPPAAECFIKLSGGEAVLNTAEAIIECVRKNEAICATLLKGAAAMSLQEIREELSLDSAEFQGHFHILRHYRARHTPGDVARYLWKNQILLRATQAQQIFDALVNKISRAQQPSHLGRGGPRAQLILALHSFCSEPYAIWEPKDDCDECLWANMRWGDDLKHCSHLQQGRYHLRGQLTNIPSSSSSGSPPQAKHQDVSRLRSVLNARRNNNSTPLVSMTFLEAYDYSWRTLS